MMKVKDLITKLKKLKQNQYIKIASDEEWNTIYRSIKIEKDKDYNAYILFGLSKTEEEN